MNADRSGKLKLRLVGRLVGRAVLPDGALAPHCAVHTSSRCTASRGHSRCNCAQSVIRSDAH